MGNIGRQNDFSRMSGRQMSNIDMSDRQMSERQMSRMGGQRQYSDMADRQNFGMSMADRQMSGHQYMADRQMTDRRVGNQQMSLPEQVVDFPQYYKRDDFGNYAYGYSNGVLEKFETGNPRSGVKGHYMYVDSNGLNQ